MGKNSWSEEKTILKGLMYEPLWKLDLGSTEDQPPIEGTVLVSLLVSMKSYLLDSESDRLLASPL